LAARVGVAFFTAIGVFPKLFNRNKKTSIFLSSMEISIKLLLIAKSHKSKTIVPYDDYDGIRVSRSVAGDGMLCIRVRFSASNQVALRSSLGNALISLVKEMKAAGVSQKHLPSAVLTSIVSSAPPREVTLLNVGGKPFIVGGGMIEDAGAIFLAATRACSEGARKGRVPEGCAG